MMQNSYAGSPLDVYSGGRSLPYPSVDQSPKGSSTKVKIDSKETYNSKAEIGRTSLDESSSHQATDDKMISQGQAIPLAVPEVQLVSELESQELEEEQPSYVGTWVRTALYVGGAPHPHDPATVNLKKDSYVSMGSCMTQGNVSSEENSISLIMMSTDCPGNLPVPMTVVYKYEISEDNNELSWSTSNQSETFVRK